MAGKRTKIKPSEPGHPTLGQKLKGDEQRDAVHVAIFPAVVATNDYLRAGDEVGLVFGTSNSIIRKDRVYGCKPIGVVDPFLEGSLDKGDRCWVFLFPNTVTGMRHEWTLPDIDNPQQPIDEHEGWLRQFAEKWNFDYDEMIAEARQGKDGYATARGKDIHSRTELKPGDEDLFWRHLEALTGEEFDEPHRLAFGWSCTC